MLAVGAAAQIAMQLFAGALADRRSRKRQMVGADLLAATAQGTLAVLVLWGGGTVALAVVLNGLCGIAYALHFPASVGLVPLVVPRERLQSANALLSMAQATAFALGAAGGGLVAATAGAGTALAIDAGTFLAAAALVGGIRPQAQPRGDGASLLRDLVLGFREFTSHTWLWAIVLQFTVMLMDAHWLVRRVGRGRARGREDLPRRRDDLGLDRRRAGARADHRWRDRFAGIVAPTLAVLCVREVRELRSA